MPMVPERKSARAGPGGLESGSCSAGDCATAAAVNWLTKGVRLGAAICAEMDCATALGHWGARVKHRKQWKALR
jgi:hypothetical protein